jgi:hypothetical protein
MDSLDEKLAAYEERRKERKPREDAEEAAREENRQEQMRQAYLTRTGRKTLTP